MEIIQVVLSTKLRRAADVAEMFEPHVQSLPHTVKIGDSVERLQLTRFGALTIAGMKRRKIPLAVALTGDGCAYARVHATT